MPTDSEIVAKRRSKDLGEYLREAREDRGLSRAQVSRKVASRSGEVSESYLENVEGGRVPTARVLGFLADAYGIPRLDLLVLAGYVDGDPVAHPPPPERTDLMSFPLRELLEAARTQMATQTKWPESTRRLGSDAISAILQALPKDRAARQVP